MRKVILTAALLAATVFQAEAADGTSRQDRELLLNHLYKTRQMVLDAVEGLSEEQAAFRAGPERWTITECLEHIAVAEATLRGLVEQGLLAAPSASAPEGARVSDQQVLEFTTNRSQKFQAPEPVRPTHRFDGLAGTLKSFLQERVRTLELVADTPEDLRARKADNPALGELDGVQWVLFLSGHSERHVRQILEVKADPNFPRSM